MHDVAVTRDEVDDARISAIVDLGVLDPADVDVQVWADPGPDRAARATGAMRAVAADGPVDEHGRTRYEARIAQSVAPPGTTFAVRVLPHHPALTDVMSAGCITWSD